MTEVIHTLDELAAVRARWAGRVGFVPTMGALHAGHASLMDVARSESDHVITSVFVNPLQFGANEDLSRYPRTLDADVALCEKAGVDVVWAPSGDDMYPGGPPQVSVVAGPLGDELEGAQRPGHFAGVLTVVSKLFHLTRPWLAFFGEKDYQQLVLIRRMVSDLNIGVHIVGVPTVREPDGLALSSRNVYLSADERTRAAAISKALFAGQDAAANGDLDAVVPTAQAVLDEYDITPDYLELRHEDLHGAPVRGESRLLVAARIGSPRLIDNVRI